MCALKNVYKNGQKFILSVISVRKMIRLPSLSQENVFDSIKWAYTFLAHLSTKCSG